ncbi:MAG: ATP-binding protein [Candidatus Promineifilaceae bacterium]|nr:ATP-binding protein [Candidatus Promineifilaceae bacterium]
MTRAAELEALADFRGLVDEACTAAGVDDDACYDLKLAVDEACTNIIQHGYAGMNPGSIILQLQVRAAETPAGEAPAVHVRITDFGHPFEPSTAPEPDVDAPLEARELGGFGLFFIYQTMDEVDYVTDGAGNHLLLTKRVEVEE